MKKILSIVVLLFVITGLAFADANTDLLAAADNGYFAGVKRALDNGADINAKDRAGGTALMVASMAGYLEIVKLLLAKGADVNIRNKYGDTALKYANAIGHAAIIKLLKAAGARE